MTQRPHRLDRTHSKPAAARCVAWALAGLLCGAATCRADSTVHSAAPTGGALSASAHLDFVVTVLPTLALSTQAAGVRVQSNAGTLALQRNAPGGWDGRPPSASLVLPSGRRGVDATLAPQAAGTELLTVAAP
jgi:hypothetical protein